MPTERQLKIADYLALQGESVDADDVATGEEAEILSRIIDNNLERVDMADRVPIDPLYDGADMLKLVLTTEFILPALGSEATIKTYTANHGFGGSQPPITIQDAFVRSRADIENQILSDPPYLYIDAGLEAIRRQQQAERNARESNGEVDSRVFIRGLTAEQVIERLIRIRERVIRDNPFTSDRSRQPRGDLVFGDSISPNRAVLNARLLAETEAIRVSLGEVVIHRVFFDVNIDGQPKTQIAYNLEAETEEDFVYGTRFITSRPVSSELRSRYELLTSIMFDGDLPVEAEGQSIEEIRADIRESQIFSSEFDYYNAATRLLEEAENVRSVLLQNLGVSEEEIDFSTVNENFDMLEAGTNDMFELLEGPESVARYASLIRPDSPLIVDDGGFEPDRVARLRSFMSTIKGFIFEIRKQDVDAQINAQRELEKLLASEEKNRILEARSFIILDSKNRSMEFRIPIEFGEKSIQVLAIKRYLGLELSSGDLFDTETKKEIQSFQNLNTNKMTELIEGDLGRPPAGQDILEMIPEEYGLIGPYTFLTMKVLGGLERAVEEVLDLGGLIPSEITGTDEDSLKTLARERARDGYRPPWKDANYYYFMYVTEETRDTVNADIPGSYERMITENGELALRKGVEELFEFHARSKTWTVEGKIQDHQVFNRLLRYQNKIEDKMSKNQSFTLTIEQQTLAENLGVSETPRVDVLFGQSLKVGAKPIFASLEEIHSPTERPNSKFKITVKIRKDLMDAIPTDPSRTATIGQTIEAARRVSRAVRDVINNRDEIARRFGDSALERQAQVEAAILDKTKSINDGLKWAQNNKKEAIEKGVKGAVGLAKKFSRDAALAKQFGNTTIASELSRKQEAALIAQVLDHHGGEYVQPITRNYTLYEFNTMVDNVAAMFDRFAKDFEDFGKEGGRIRPAIDLREEAKHLREIKPAMTSFLSANGIVKRDFLREDVQIKITFVESLMERKFLPPKDLETNTQPPEVVIEDRAGLLPIAISYIEPGKQARRLQQATLVLAQKYPWNIPRTMAYLSSLVELNSEANDYDASCLQVNLFSEELTYSEKDPIGLMQTYTHPYLFVLPGPELPSGIRTDKAEAKLANAHTSIKTSLQKIQEDLSIEGDGPVANAFRRDIVRLERNKTYPIVPELPTVELCTLESLFDEFLDKFDIKTLFCNYAACIPDLPWPPSFSWDLDFTIPEIPRMPSFDPMAIIIPRLELAILDLILGFLCGLVRGILDTLRFPDCEDLANFGKAAWDQLWHDDRGPTSRLLVMQDAAKVMDDLDIPSDAFPDVSDLFDQLANILTPAELCSLLDASADAETLTIVLELVQKSFPDLERYFRNEADVSMFFMLLGKFVDPELCNKISNTSNIIIGDIFCPDRPMVTLRRRMQDNRATSEEIAKAMSDATKRREAFKELFAKDPMADVIPAAGAGIPGPYDNDVSKELVKMSTEAALNVTETSMRNDLISFVPSLLDTVQSQKKPGDPGFNPVEEAEYRFMQAQVTQLTTTKANEVKRQLGAAKSFDDYVNQYDTVQQQIDAGAAELDALVLVGQNVEVTGRNQNIITGLTEEQQRLLETGEIFARGRDNPVGSDLDFNLQIPNVIVKIKRLRRRSGFIVIDTSNSPDNIIVDNVTGDRTDLAGAIEMQERLRNVLQQIVAQRAAESLKMAKPGRLTQNDDGTFECNAATRDLGDGNTEIVFFDFEDRSDIAAMIHILSFPLRNVKDEAKVATFVDGALSAIQIQTNVEKKFTAPYNFYNEEAQYMDPGQLMSDVSALRIMGEQPEDRHLFIGLGSEKADMSNLDTVGEFQPKLTYQEIPIKSDHVHDCYNFHYPGRLLTLGDNSMIWRGKTYNDELSEYARAKRMLVRDIEEDSGRTLLRPAAFAELFLNSWQNATFTLGGDGGLNASLGSNQIDGYGNTLWEKLAGSVSPPPAGDSQIRGEYENIVENFVDDIANELSSSRFFTLDGIKELATELTAEFKLSSDGTCFVEKEPFIDFEKLRDDIADAYQDSLSQEEYNPANRDFSKPGPLEDSLAGQLVFLYTKTFLIEFMLKGLFFFSRFSPGRVFEQDIVKDYIKTYMLASLEVDLSKDIAGVFADEVRKLGNDSDLSEAIKNIVESVTEDIDFIESIDRAFQPQFASYKDRFILDLMSRVKSVQSYSNIKPPTRRQRNITYTERNGDSRVSGPNSESRRGFVPLHSSFGGLFTSNESGVELLKRGHFFVEKYYTFNPSLYHTYFEADDSLIKRIIEAAKTISRVGNRGRPKKTFYSHEQYSGVFNDRELFMLLDELNEFSVREDGGEGRESLREEIEQMVDSFNIPGGLKMGLRLVYVPATSGAGQVVGRTIKMRTVPGFEDAATPLQETYDTFSYEIDEKAQRRAISEDDILAQQISDLIGEDYENMLLGGNNPPDLDDIVQTAATVKHRSYVADTNPIMPVPASDNYLNIIIEANGNIARTPAQRFHGGIAKPNWRDTQYNEDYTDRYDSAKVAMGVPYLTVDRRDEDNPLIDIADRPAYPGRPQNILFPTPLFNSEVDICFRDLYDLHLAEEGQEQGDQEQRAQRLLKDKFSLLRQQFSGVTLNENFELEITGEMSEDMKYVFEFLFPLDRYQSMFLIQNALVMDKSPAITTLMNPTRNIINALVQEIKDPIKLNRRPRLNGKNVYSILLSDQTSGGPGPMAKYKLGGFGDAIEKMAKRTIPTLIRGQAAFLDPAYKDIKDVFDKDPCKIKAGLTAASLGLPFSLSANIEGDKQLENGLDDNKAYNPFNIQGATDLTIVMNLIAWSGGAASLAYMAPLLNIIQHMSNSITDANPRYGKFLTPIGLLALAMPELPGEVHRNKIREANCGPDDTRRSPRDFVICEDVERQEEE